MKIEELYDAIKADLAILEQLIHGWWAPIAHKDDMTRERVVALYEYRVSIVEKILMAIKDSKMAPITNRLAFAQFSNETHNELRRHREVWPVIIYGVYTYSMFYVREEENDVILKLQYNVDIILDTAILYKTYNI